MGKLNWQLLCYEVVCKPWDSRFKSPLGNKTTKKNIISFTTQSKLNRSCTNFQCGGMMGQEISFFLSTLTDSFIHFYLLDASIIIIFAYLCHYPYVYMSLEPLRLHEIPSKLMCPLFLYVFFIKQANCRH